MAKKLAVDRWLFTVIVVLVVIGLVMVFSASSAVARGRGEGLNPFLVKQAAAAALGFALMLGLMHLDYRRLRSPRVVWGALAVVVLMLVGVLFAPELNNTRRWFFVAGVSVQPSELAKLALILYLAYQLERRHDRVNEPELLLPVAVVTGLVAGLVVLEPDLGTAVLLLVVALVVLFLAGLSWRFLIGGAVALAPVVAVLVITSPYRFRRLLAFVNPESDPLDAGYQPLNSLIAVGSGGLFGRGLGQSLQKLYFLPQPHSDFVYAILAEELGLIGALAVLALFAVLAWRGARAGLLAPDPFGRFLAWGITAAVTIQALINLSVAVALLPTKGIPLPFISYGGSSLVVTLAACGVLLNVSEHG